MINKSMLEIKRQARRNNVLDQLENLDAGERAYLVECANGQDLATYCLDSCTDYIDWDTNEDVADCALYIAIKQALKVSNKNFDVDSVFEYAFEYADENKTPMQVVQDCIEDGWEE